MTFNKRIFQISNLNARYFLWAAAFFFLMGSQVTNPATKQTQQEIKLDAGYYRLGKKILYADEHDVHGELRGADAKSFKILGDGFSKDKNKVYWVSETLFELKTADPATFIHFPGTPYSADQRHVFYYIELIPAAHAKTFKALSGVFAKDKNQVYYGNKVIQNIKPNDFEIFNGNSHYGHNKKQIIYGTGVVAAANLKYFVPLNKHFGKDKDHVFWGGQITKYDPSSFYVFPTGFYVKDKTGVYSLFPNFGNDPPKKLKMADAGSFSEIHFDIYGFYTKDKNHVYFNDEIITGANPETFRFIDYLYSKDKDHVYRKGILLQGIKPSQFKFEKFDFKSYCKQYHDGNC